jgi:hypothetical protein
MYTVTVDSPNNDDADADAIIQSRSCSGPALAGLLLSESSSQAAHSGSGLAWPRPRVLVENSRNSISAMDEGALKSLTILLGGC